MGKPISEDGRIIQGKYEGYFVYLWKTNESLSIHKERIYESGLLTASNKQSSQVFIINKDSITDTQDMGSAVHKANTEAVLKVGFWFGAVAAIAANQIGTRESYTVAIEYPDGERSLLQLNSYAYQTLKSIKFALNEDNRKKQFESENTTARTTNLSNNTNESNDQVVSNQTQVVKRQILINTENIQASVKRAFLFLEDEEWETAEEYFDSILDIDPENAEAYLGKLMAQKRVSQKDEIVNQDNSFFEDKLFKRALRFADDTIKDELESYQSKKAENENNEFFERAYKSIVEEKNCAQTPYQYNLLQKKFIAFKGYKDTALLADQCSTKAKKLTEANYSRAHELMNEKKYLEAIRFFISVIDYRDSRAQSEKCAREIEGERKIYSNELSDIQEIDKNLQIEKDQLEHRIDAIKQNIRDYNIRQKEIEQMNEEYARIKKRIEGFETELSELGRFSISKKKKIQNEIDFYNGELERTFIKISEKENTTYTNQNLQTDSREIEESEKRINEINQIHQNNEARLGELNKLLNSMICFSPETFQNKNVDVFGVISDSTLYLFWTNSMNTIISNDYLSQNKINEVVVMPGITTIPNYAFKDCNSLKRVAISDSVTRIENGAFFGCNGLVEITIPSGVILIGENAFSMCNNLSDVTFRNNNLKTIGEACFGFCNNLMSIAIPDSVTHIDRNAFSGCKNLEMIKLPSELLTLGAEAFEYCDNLVSITFNTKIKKIEERTFASCVNLTKVTIPDSVTFIDKEAFWGCKNLTTVHMSGRVQHIGESAFAFCSKLQSITLPPNVVLGKDAFLFTKIE